MKLSRSLFTLQSPETDPAGGTGTGSPAGATPPADSASGDDRSEVERVHGALVKEREENKALQRRLAALESQLKEVGNANPRLLEETQARARQLEEDRRLSDERARLDREQIERKFSDQITKTNEELKAEREARQREAVRNQTEKAFLAAKGSMVVSKVDGSTPFDAIWRTFGDRFSVDDRGALVVLDTDGTPALDEETGKRIEPSAWLAKLRSDPVHGLNFQPEYGSGSGARSTRDGRVIPGRDLMKTPLGTLFSQEFGGGRDAA